MYEVRNPELTETGQTQFAYKLAALALFINAVLAVIGTFIVSGTILSFEIGAALVSAYFGYRLLKFDQRVRRWVLIIAIGGAIAFSILDYAIYDQFSFLLNSFIRICYAISITLLLTGKSTRWRILIAVEIYIIFFLGPTGALYLLYFFQQLG